jgi:hypothetical protein
MISYQCLMLSIARAQQPALGYRDYHCWFFMGSCRIVIVSTVVLYPSIGL